MKTLNDVFAGDIGFKEFHDKLQKQFEADNTFLKYILRGFRIKDRGLVLEDTE